MNIIEVLNPASIAAIQTKYGARYFKDFEDLPFVYREGEYKNWSSWSVPPISDYTEACEIGNYYAACYLEHLKNSPDEEDMNGIGLIAKDIDFKDESCAKGYHVGFFSFIESFAHHGVRHSDMWATFDRKTIFCREMIAQGDAEEAMQ